MKRGKYKTKRKREQKKMKGGKDKEENTKMTVSMRWKNKGLHFIISSFSLDYFFSFHP